MEATGVLKIENIPITVALIACFAIGTGAQTKSTSPETNYWPMKAGTTWTVETMVNKKLISQVVTVAEVTPEKETETDGYVAILEYRSGATLLQKEKYRVNSHGVSHIASGVAPNDAEYSPPLPDIIYPLVNGARWYWSGEIHAGGKKTPAAAVMTASGPEPMTLPTGTFQAMKVHVDLSVNLSGKKSVSTNECWYVPNIGLVNQKTTIGKLVIENKTTAYTIK